MSSVAPEVQTPRPKALEVLPDNIPDELKSLNQWVVWKYDWRDGKWSKTPYRVNGGLADASKRTTWTTFDRAFACYQANAYDGIGFVFSVDDPFAGVDLDNAVVDNRLKPWASNIVDRFSTYMETSPSGSGVKLYCRGSLPTDKTGGRNDNYHDGKVEAYHKVRYFAVTGHSFLGSIPKVQDSSEQLEWLWANLVSKKRSELNGHATADSDDPATAFAIAKAGQKDSPALPSSPPVLGQAPDNDDEILKKAQTARNGAKFRRLWDGDATNYGNDESRADEALCSMLAFWCGPDAARIERLFGRSALGQREKWTSRGDYRKSTVAFAVEHSSSFYNWSSRPKRKTKSRPKISATDDSKTIPPVSAENGRTEVQNGRRLARKYNSDVRWCDVWGKWLIWDNKRWNVDKERRMEQFGKDVQHMLWQEIRELEASVDDADLKAMTAFAKASGSARGVEATLKMARSESGIPIQPEQLDADAWVLNVENGTLDLRTGTLRPHDRADYLTKLCPTQFEPEAKCPTWSTFLERVTAGDRELMEFLARCVGLSLVGQVREHILLFLYGQGANGKSTFLNTVQTMLGADFAMKATPDLLMARAGETHPTECADLAGKRFVACIEAENGRRLAEALVKELTGGDRVRARRMREDFWEFEPQHTVWLASNYKPSIRGTDDGIWRRIKLVPFTISIPDAEQDKLLTEKLRGELPGILAWAVRGCLAWQRDGLVTSKAVTAATGEYRAEMDVLRQFIDDRCVIDLKAEVAATDLYAVYKAWAEDAGEKPITQTAFGIAMRERRDGSGNRLFIRDKYSSGKEKNRIRWRGIKIRLASDRESQDER